MRSKVELFKLEGVEKLVVNVIGLPAKTEFDIFIIVDLDATSR